MRDQYVWTRSKTGKKEGEEGRKSAAAHPPLPLVWIRERKTGDDEDVYDGNKDDDGGSVAECCVTNDKEGDGGSVAVLCNKRQGR